MGRVRRLNDTVLWVSLNGTGLEGIRKSPVTLNRYTRKCVGLGQLVNTPEPLVRASELPQLRLSIRELLLQFKWACRLVPDRRVPEILTRVWDPEFVTTGLETLVI